MRSGVSAMRNPYDIIIPNFHYLLKVGGRKDLCVSRFRSSAISGVTQCSNRSVLIYLIVRCCPCRTVSFSNPKATRRSLLNETSIDCSNRHSCWKTGCARFSATLTCGKDSENQTGNDHSHDENRLRLLPLAFLLDQSLQRLLFVGIFSRPLKCSSSIRTRRRLQPLCPLFQRFDPPFMALEMKTKSLLEILFSDLGKQSPNRNRI